MVEPHFLGFLHCLCTKPFWWIYPAIWPSRANKTKNKEEDVWLYLSFYLPTLTMHGTYYTIIYKGNTFKTLAFLVWSLSWPRPEALMAPCWWWCCNVVAFDPHIAGDGVWRGPGGHQVERCMVMFPLPVRSHHFCFCTNQWSVPQIWSVPS